MMVIRITQQAYCIFPEIVRDFLATIHEKMLFNVEGDRILPEGLTKGT